MNIRNVGLPLVSLLLAAAVWYFLHGIAAEKSARPIALKTLTVAVKLMGEPLVLGRNVVFVELERPAVDIRVRGPGHLVEQLSGADLVAYIDVTGLTPGKSYSPVVHVVLPPHIELVGALPLVRVEIKGTRL